MADSRRSIRVPLRLLHRGHVTRAKNISAVANQSTMNRRGRADAPQCEVERNVDDRRCSAGSDAVMDGVLHGDGVRRRLRLWREGDKPVLEEILEVSREAFADWLPGVTSDLADLEVFLDHASEASRLECGVVLRR